MEFFPVEQVTVLAVTYGTRVLGAIVFLILALWFSSRLSGLVVAGMERAKIEPTLTRFTGNIVRWVILAVVLISVMGIFGVQTTSFAALIAAGGLAMGLAFQGTLSNLAAGVMLMLFRPFKVGQFIKVAGEMGTVFEIDLFSTKIDTTDNRHIILPNSAVFGTTIENVSHHATRRIDLPVGVDYAADIDKTKEVLLAAVADIPGILREPQEPAAILQGLGASSVDWQVRAWATREEFWPTRQAMIRAIKMALDANKINIPFPQMDVHLKQKPMDN